MKFLLRKEPFPSNTEFNLIPQTKFMGLNYNSGLRKSIPLVPKSQQQLFYLPSRSAKHTFKKKSSGLIELS